MIKQIIPILLLLMLTACNDYFKVTTGASTTNSEPTWRMHLGSTNIGSFGAVSDIENSNKVLVNSQGEVYSLGTTTSNLADTTAGGQDVWVMKQSKNGAIEWIQQYGLTHTEIPGSAGNEILTDAAIDSEGNIIMVGYTNGAMIETVGGGWDAFIIKIDKDGDLVWKKQYGNVTASPGGSNAGNDFFEALIVDSQDNLYVSFMSTGVFVRAAIDWDTGIIKFDPDGDILWSNQLDNNNPGFTLDQNEKQAIRNLALDSTGNIYFSGGTRGSFIETNADVTKWDLFFGKVNSAGALQWIRQLGDVSKPMGADVSGNEYQYGGIVFDSTGNPIFLSGVETTVSDTLSGARDLFFTKMDKSSGNFLTFKQFGQSQAILGFDTTGSDTVTGVVQQSNGDIIVAGSTSGSLFETNAGGTDIFVAKINTDGDLVSGRQLGAVTLPAGQGLLTDACGNRSIFLDSKSQVYLACRILSNMGDTNPDPSEADALVIKYGVYQ